MKTLIFNGSPKKNGDTVALIDEFKKHLKGDIKVISAHFDDISPCIDCRYCWRNSGCSINDKMQEVYEYIEECDNIVIASPIWFSELSGPLLNVASRVQTYFAAKYFRGIDAIPKTKNSVLILAGAEKGTELKASTTAHTIFKFFNALPCVATVLSLDTNNIPAEDDVHALYQAEEAAKLLNDLYEEILNNKE